MVTKEFKQPNGKYMGFQTTANMMHWNYEESFWADNSGVLDYESWEDFCESVEANQGFTKAQLEKLIEELPEQGICDYSGFNYSEHWDYMHRDRNFPHENKEDPNYPTKNCSECKFFQKWQDIMFSDMEETNDEIN